MGTPPPERPAGPPAGPLSGGGQDAPTGPPTPTPPTPPTPPAPPGGPGGRGGPGGPGGPGEPAGKPWWRSGPRLATALVALAAVVALAVVLTRPTGVTERADGEVFLQPAAATGPDPFTESTATTQATPPPASPPPTTGPTQGTTVTRSVNGASPGLYGATKDAASCDVEKQIRVLTAQPAKNGAFASVLGIRPADVAGYLRSLTPVQLRMDTRVTNHGFKDGRAQPYQAVLQTGTAVLVDGKGVPRVRCACGNPLKEPVPLKPDSKRHGQPWSAYHPQNVVVITPSAKVINKIVIYDYENRRWYERGRGPKPTPDKPVPPPAAPTPTYSTPPPTSPLPSTTPPGTGIPSGTPTTPLPSPSPSPSPSPTEETGTPSEPASPSPPETAPSGTEPTSAPPTSEPPYGPKTSGESPSEPAPTEPASSEAPALPYP
ncbi:DUF6777 domain-containing protein [Streptomyces sp. NPDC002990]